MFKKFKGFSTRLKKPRESETTHNIYKNDNNNSKKEDRTNSNTSLKWPKIQNETSFKLNKKSIKNILKSVKEFTFPEIKPGSLDFFQLFAKLFNFLRDKFLINKSAMLGVLFGFILAIVILFISVIIYDFRRVVGLAEYQPNITTKIYDKNELLVSELFRQKREVVPLSKIPGNVTNAFIAIEDIEFYDHFGLNFKGITRAFFINLFSGKIKQGGSTITQQLAKILLTSRERNILRKIKEASISFMIEIFYTKDEILELYLNQIFLGHGVYGIESASKFYFNKHVWELNVAEGALLATLPSSPNKLSPIRHTERSIERHKIVLAKMADCGFITIDNAEKAFLDFWPGYLDYINDLSPSITSWSRKIDKAPWFTEYLRRKLIKQFGEDMVYKEGLSIYTTLDIKKQTAAQKIFQEGLIKQTTVSSGLSFKNEDYIIDNFSEISELFSLLYNINPRFKRGSLDLKQVNDYIKEGVLDELDSFNLFFENSNISRLLTRYREKQSGYKTSEKVQGCLVSINHRTGYIEAMVGGTEFSSINQLNRVMQTRRQAGSSIKPLLYAAAIESKKFTPATAILDSPLLYIDTEGGDWIPGNYEEKYYGMVRLRTALEKSINVVSVRIAEELGLDYIVDYYAKLLKIEKKERNERLPRNLSIALGSIDVAPFELTRAYAIIANGGKDVIPYSIRYIKNRNGDIIDNPEEAIHASLKKETEGGIIQIINPDTSNIMISLLRSVMSSGTGISASMGRPAGGKTGTTNNWKDAWFVGFTPQLTTCMWVGYDNPGLSLGQGQTGGVIVAPMWREYMKEALEGEPYLEFPYYGSVVAEKVCANSGLLPSSYCRQIIDEIFLEGTVPEKECEFCKDFEYDLNPKKTTPKDNIAGGQRDSIMDSISSKKDTSNILNNIGKDLLD